MAAPVTIQDLFRAVRGHNRVFLAANVTPLNVNDIHPNLQCTMLHEAVVAMNPDTVEFLLSRGANPSIPNNTGHTPAGLYRSNNGRLGWNNDMMKITLRDLP